MGEEEEGGGEEEKERGGGRGGGGGRRENGEGGRERERERKLTRRNPTDRDRCTPVSPLVDSMHRDSDLHSLRGVVGVRGQSREECTPVILSRHLLRRVALPAERGRHDDLEVPVQIVEQEDPEFSAMRPAHSQYPCSNGVSSN